MVWNVLFLLFSPWYLLLGRLLRDDRDRQILLLHQQLLIAQRRVGKRLSLSRGEKLTLVLGSLGMKTRQLLDSLVLIKPTTVVGWHREIVRRHWTFPAERRPGRPPISEPARSLRRPAPHRLPSSPPKPCLICEQSRLPHFNRAEAPDAA